eukprot:gnl/TRDRNA2_/TRDRNA2_135663_c0_seq1.p1 gnl/TRDRNA2_/TRDRNA2_135663_c0~~gnl/TRDRNA2_/TRDRNA2_135663_c0_seq1.p1  ORF type:complete len:1053 (-),score=204.75 gnl/TRDRNA2_/TRDRNA2_135663_c0_seq1:92-3157(-)
MDDFERAVLVVFTQDATISPDVRAQATSYCDSIKARPDGWHFCWAQFLQKQRLEVRFWCLQAIVALLGGLAPEARAELRASVLSWLRDVASAKQEDLVVRNKIALVYVGLIRLDYPAGWPSAWTDLIALLERGPNMVDMFLRVLAVFDQEVVTDEVPRSAEDRQRSQSMKHAMRERDVMHLAECWYMILGTFRQSAPQLVTDCLKAITVYIVWVEIQIIANAKFLEAIGSLIAEAGPSASEACECLSAVLSKKMPAGKKVQMLQQLQILQLLQQRCLHRDSKDLNLLEKEAELFNSVAGVALDAYVDLRVQQDQESAAFAQAAWDCVSSLMPSVFWFFSHQEYQVADSVEPFLTEFFAKVKSFVGGTSGEKKGGKDADDMGDNQSQPPCHTVMLDQVRPILIQTLQLIIQRIAYPDWFQHGDPRYEDDEQHIAFLEFRRSLGKIFKRIFLVDEHMGFEFVQASVAQLTQSLSSVRPMEAEAVLFLFKEAGELVKDLAHHLKASGPLAGCFVQLVECQALVHAEHWAVQLALIELYVRYGRIFAIHTELFPRCGQRVLEAFVGRQGVRSADPRVVTRACFMLSRFVKLVKLQVAPVTVQLYEALQDLLVVQYIPSTLVPAGQEGKVVVRGALKLEDQASLYEALANLIAAMPAEQMRAALQLVLKSPAGNLTEIVSGAQSKLASDWLGYAQWAARSIEAIATVSKAFTPQQSATTADWKDVLEVVARVLEKFAGRLKREAGLWRAVLFLCRRMVEVLTDQFLGPLDTLLPLLYSATDQQDLIELSIFAHHVVCQYQQKSQPLLQKWLGVLFARPYEVWRGMPEDSEQLKREKLELGCALLQLLKEAAVRCPLALLEVMMRQNGNSGPGSGVDLINFLVLGLSDPSELRALFLTVSTWSALLEKIAGTPGAQEAVSALPLGQILQRLIWSVARMDFSDAQAQKILGEAPAVLKSLTGGQLLPQGCQQQAMEALQQALVAALPGLRTDTAPRQLCTALAQDCPLKDVRAALQQCAVDWRRESGS